MSGPPPPLVAQPVQPGVANAVQPKRKKNKLAPLQQPGHVPPHIPVQPMMAYNVPAHVPQTGLSGGSVPPLAAPPVTMAPPAMATPALVSKLSDSTPRDALMVPE
jgi:hypothetical protein